MRSRDFRLALAAFLVATAPAALAGEYGMRPEVGYGKPIDEAALSLWDIDIATPTGGNLPPGEGSVQSGQAVFEAKCVGCHGEKAAGGPVYGTLVGGIGSMTKSPRVLTPGSMYPYAPILFDYVRRAMPMDAPQSLTNDEVYGLAAYIYNLNGLVPDDFRMNAQTMPTITMPNRDGFIRDDRPDTHAVRCMSDCKPIGTVADAAKAPSSATPAAAGGSSNKSVTGDTKAASPPQ